MLAKILITTAAMAGISGFLSIILVIAERFFADYGKSKITINEEKEIIVKGGSSLLATLNSAKIFLPSACGGRGTCAYCKCKVLEGVGQLLPTEEPLLTKDEISRKFRLACQVKVKQDLKIEIPAELFKIKEFEADVELLTDLTYDIKLVRLRLINPEAIIFKSGQYVQLQSKPYENVKETVSRAYSIASANSTTNYIDLMIRLVPDGILTTWLFNNMKSGERVKFTGPMGDFSLHEGEGEMIFIAGGSGMAPMACLLHEIQKKQIERKVTYFFGVNTKKDLFFDEEMEQFEKSIPNFKYVPALARPESEDNWQGMTGLITEPLENYLINTNGKKAQAYLCGSPGMINACINVLKKHGVASDRIFFDPFV